MGENGTCQRCHRDHKKCSLAKGKTKVTSRSRTPGSHQVVDAIADLGLRVDDDGGLVGALLEDVSEVIVEQRQMIVDVAKVKADFHQSSHFTGLLAGRVHELELKIDRLLKAISEKEKGE